MLSDDKKMELAEGFKTQIQLVDNTEDMKQAFLRYYLDLGWKVLCRIAFLEQSPEHALRLD